MDSSYLQKSPGVSSPQRDDAGSERTAYAAMSPADCCWICERPLPRYPRAAFVEQGNIDYFYLVCSESCGYVVARELATTLGATVKQLDGISAFARFCEASTRSIVEFSEEAFDAYRQGQRLHVTVLNLDNRRTGR